MPVVSRLACKVATARLTYFTIGAHNLMSFLFIDAAAREKLVLRVDRVPILIVSLSVKCLRELFAVLFECVRFFFVKNERVLVL